MTLHAAQALHGDGCALRGTGPGGLL